MSRGKYSAPRTSPTPSRARNIPTTDWQRSRDRWSRQGKKALFFGGSTPFLWASTKEMGSNGRTGQRKPPKETAHTHKSKEKGGTPGEGSPLDPLLRSNKHKRVPRSAERGQGLCPWTPPPLKRWTKLSFAREARNYFRNSALRSSPRGSRRVL